MNNTPIFFQVWAKVKFPDKHQFQDGKSTLCAFLVDAKESTGIKVDKNNLYPVKGLKASGITSVKFENVMVFFQKLYFLILL